jgi:diadenosine tetraphosphate (Ap4A) HIT family hydrolase
MEVMVVVDRFSQAPKLLVIPKRELMFPLDTPRSLIDRLAQVSAGASDALIVAAGRKCSSKTYADIWINPPRALSVKQLHVHVRPRTPIVGNADTIYARTERRLRDVL